MLNTLQPEYLQQIMGHANEQRMAAFGEGQQKQTIQISQYWEEQLKAMPYLSRKYPRIPSTKSSISIARFFHFCPFFSSLPVLSILLLF